MCYECLPHPRCLRTQNTFVLSGLSGNLYAKQLPGNLYGQSSAFGSEATQHKNTYLTDVPEFVLDRDLAVTVGLAGVVRAFVLEIQNS